MLEIIETIVLVFMFLVLLAGTSFLFIEVIFEKTKKKKIPRWVVIVQLIIKLLIIFLVIPITVINLIQNEILLVIIWIILFIANTFGAIVEIQKLKKFNVM